MVDVTGNKNLALKMFTFYHFEYFLWVGVVCAVVVAQEEFDSGPSEASRKPSLTIWCV